MAPAKTPTTTALRDAVSMWKREGGASAAMRSHNPGPGEQAAWPDEQSREEDEMPGQKLPLRVDGSADRLRYAQKNTPCERAP